MNCGTVRITTHCHSVLGTRNHRVCNSGHNSGSLCCSLCQTTLCIREGCRLTTRCIPPLGRTDRNITRYILGGSTSICDCESQSCRVYIFTCDLWSIPAPRTSQSGDLTADCLESVDIGSNNRLTVKSNHGLKIGVCVILAVHRPDCDIGGNTDCIITAVKSDSHDAVCCGG